MNEESDIARAAEMLTGLARLLAMRDGLDDDGEIDGDSLGRLAKVGGALAEVAPDAVPSACAVVADDGAAIMLTICATARRPRLPFDRYAP